MRPLRRCQVAASGLMMWLMLYARWSACHVTLSAGTIWATFMALRCVSVVLESALFLTSMHPQAQGHGMSWRASVLGEGVFSIAGPLVANFCVRQAVSMSGATVYSWHRL